MDIFFNHYFFLLAPVELYTEGVLAFTAPKYSPRWKPVRCAAANSSSSESVVILQKMDNYSTYTASSLLVAGKSDARTVFAPPAGALRSHRTLRRYAHSLHPFCRHRIRCVIHH